ncbi:protein Mo25 [Biomphalaria glabrata]|uniref:Protein Mo25-like n=2 Tax=Biomphalaria TaxID=6525 RepID=A0A2C9JJG0_BIOGL|nr:protein Mo25-like [Biomphalaria glabrata]KAI8751470.1 protein Mo25-like [Biomphalaria glabrata]KAI8770555.1 protein Mo25 [Biomphalaria glabrata]KAK0066665.1 protein Mo25 [Biomphalaria pfeifferi]
MPLFGTKTKSPQELVKSLKENLALLPNLKEKEYKKVSEEVSKTLQSIKTLLYGTADQEPATEQVAMLSTEMYQSNTLPLLIQNLARVDFEGRKDVVAIFNNLLRRQIGTRTPTEEYICLNHSVLIELVKGYENQEIALNCGMMLRECCRFESLAKILLNAPEFYKFFEYVEVSTFDIASDAFSTFKELLTKHKMLSAEFLEHNYDEVFMHYQSLLNSDNYVTRRQALKLLGELLLDRHNFSTMNRYISNPENLKLMMNMLREKSRNIQFEAFHVFKIFVANPNKPRPILDILLRNKEKLVDFLTRFHTERSEDEQFNDEKSYLIKQIKELRAPEEGES